MQEPDLLPADDLRQACVMMNLRRAARAVSRRYEAALRPVDLTASQFSLLAALSRPDPAPLGPVAAELGMDRTTLTRVLTPLKRRGLVTATPTPGDGRVRNLALTAQGRALMARAMDLWRSAQADAASRLGPDAWPDLRRALDALS